MTSTNLTADAIAAAVGYQNTSTLRALVRRRRGSTISALRPGRQADGLEDARLGPRRRSCARIFCCPVVRDGSLAGWPDRPAGPAACPRADSRSGARLRQGGVAARHGREIRRRRRQPGRCQRCRCGSGDYGRPRRGQGGGIHRAGTRVRPGRVDHPSWRVISGGVYLEPDYPVSLFDMYFKNLQIRLNGFANAMTGQWRPMLAIEQGAIDPATVVTHRMNLDDFPSAAAAFAAREDGFLKMVIRP